MKTTLTATACAMLLWAGTALGAPTEQQNCDYARMTAWKVYVSCVEAVLAKDAKTEDFDEFKAFWKCRHTHFQKWVRLQNPRRRPSVAGSTCVGNRFTDNGDGTVTDSFTNLVWEKKTNLDGTPNYADVHDADNQYSLTTGSKEDGTAFTAFLTTGLNTPGFAGSNGWRLPTLAELQTILADFPCTGEGDGATCVCTSIPCIGFKDPNTQSFDYWSATNWVPDPAGGAWFVLFTDGYPFGGSLPTVTFYVRAVRGGL